MKKEIIICPKCKKEINKLFWEKEQKHNGSLGIDKEGNEEFDENYSLEYEQTSCKYFCPECDEVLFNDDEKAITFLKGVEE